MGRTDAGVENQREALREIVHDLKSATSAAVAYLALALESIERGEETAEGDLERLAGSLARLGTVTDRLDDLTRKGDGA